MNLPNDFPQKGDVIAGKYQIEEILGQGGMGVVVAARHLALRQRVAVKFLLPVALRLPEAAARFLREARAAVAIQSEHVARVLDVGTLETGAPYMVMEHLSGTDFSRLLKERGPLPISQAVDFILQACDAIAEAHLLGIVHRDLKPGNLFLTHRAEGSPLVKVLDFGLSKRTTDDTTEGSLTATGIIAGSPSYMSPEQIRSLKYIDWRTDIWALGVILYELLTGRRPFEGKTLTAICASVIADTPSPVSVHRPEVPSPLNTLIFMCLEKDVNRRMQSVGKLAKGLSPFGSLNSAHLVERIERLQPSVPLVVAESEPRDSAKESDAAVTVIWPPIATGSAATEPLPKVLPKDESSPPVPIETPGSATSQSNAWGKTGPISKRKPIAALAVAAIGIVTLVWFSLRNESPVPATSFTPLPSTTEGLPSTSASPVASSNPIEPTSSATPTSSSIRTESSATPTSPSAPVFSGPDAPVAPRDSGAPVTESTGRPLVIQKPFLPKPKSTSKVLDNPY